MSRDDQIGCFGAIVFIIGMVIGSVGGCYFGTGIVQQEAIKHGVAEWRVNKETGETSFVYKELKK